MPDTPADDAPVSVFPAALTGLLLNQHLPAQVMLVDHQYRLRYLNSAPLGHAGGKTGGGDALDLFAPDEQAAVRALLDQTLRDHQPGQGEFAAHAPAGARATWLRVRAIPLEEPGWERHLLLVATDVSDHYRLRQQQHTQHLLREGITQSRQIGMALDREGRIREWNDLAAEAFGHTREEVLGRTAFDLLYEEPYRSRIRRYFTQAMQGTVTIGHARLPLCTRDGRTLTCDWFSIPLFDADGIAGMLSVGQDVTATLETEQSLIAARRSAEAMAEARSRFVANMSHELRTPLHGIVSATELLYDQDLPEPLRDTLEIVRTSSRTLLTLVNDILDFARIDAGGMPLNPQPLSLRALLAEVRELLWHMAQEKQLDFQVDYPATLPTSIIGDPDRLRQILVNLASNAIKFTPAGHVTLRVGAEARAEDWLFAITVEDSGIGIPASQLSHIFEDFRQADDSITRHHGGTGLGLTISRGLARLMGGDITATSEPGRGSRFTLRLPARLATPPQPVPAAAKPSRNYNRRVLLVDDNSVNLAVACKMLVALGLWVDTATDGAQALTRATLERFDMILMDIQMPVMDGIEATRAIRALGYHQACVPVIAVTANVLEEDRQRCFAAGMDAVITKPFRMADLTAVLDQWFQPEDA